MKEKLKQDLIKLSSMEGGFCVWDMMEKSFILREIFRFYDSITNGFRDRIWGNLVYYLWRSRFCWKIGRF